MKETKTQLSRAQLEKIISYLVLRVKYRRLKNELFNEVPDVY